MTIKQAAEFLQVHPYAVYRLIKTDDLPATKVMNRWRFDKDEIKKWLKERQFKSEEK